MKRGIVVFGGAGAGAVDLLTLRCRDAIAAADLIVYAGSLVNPDVLQFASPHVVVHDSAGMTLEQTTAVMVAACRANQRVLRLHTGDPSMYGAIAEQIVELETAGIGYEVIPGVSSVFAAAATLRRELTLPGATQTVILSRRAGRTPVPEGEDIPSLAAHGATMALYLSVSDMGALVKELLAGAYTEDTPAAVVYRASWPDEKRIEGTLATIADQVADAGIRRQALVLVGDALSGVGEPSCLYAANFAHGYRDVVSSPDVPTPVSLPAKPLSIPFAGRVAVYALTAAGCSLAAELAATIGADAYVSKTHAVGEGAVCFDPRAIGGLIAEQWDRYDGHVMIMASGIAMRKVAPLLRDKTQDPAVVVCDEKGRFAISLAGGHIAGANRLSHQVAGALRGTAVVTTATDVQGIPAFDELAALHGWHICDRDKIKTINSALLAKHPIGFVGPAALVERYYGDASDVRVLAPDAPIPPELHALVTLDADVSETVSIPVLALKSCPLVVGIGCRRDTSEADIAKAVSNTLAAHDLPLHRVSALCSAVAKQEEPGLLAYAKNQDLPIRFFAEGELQEIPVPTPSMMPQKHIGTPSVAEAAALLGSGGRLLISKQKYDGKVTVAVAVKPI